MSEYQYYEFQAIDRPLNDKEMKYISGLSSRVDLTPNRAIFIYNFGNFRGKPLEVLEKHFDAYLYLANWGTKQLAFRFPKEVVDPLSWEPYGMNMEYMETVVTTLVKKDHVIFDIRYQNNEGFDDWIEGEGWLNSLSVLRQDILRGDFRALYLAWLGSLYFMPVDEDTVRQPEPPVPPNLKNLSKPLRDFIEFFRIDEDLVAAAAEASPEETEVEPDVEGLITQMPEQEKNDLLIKLAKGDSNVAVRLAKRLHDLSAPKGVTRAKEQRRTVAELLAAAEVKKKQREDKKRKDAEKAKIKKLKELSGRQPELWKEVFALIGKMNSKAYDEAVNILIDLRDVGEYLGEQDRFKKNLADIYEQYKGRSGLLSRLKDKKLI